MARPRSDERRTALLNAATRVFAEHGLSAPTALVSKQAKVSEGSFFTYFKTKDDLVLALYRELRLELAAAVLSDFPAKAGLQERLTHVFTRYVTWGVTNPLGKRALRHVSMAKVITPEVRHDGLFAEVDRIQAEAMEQRRLTIPPVMASLTLKAIAEMTMDLIEQQPSKKALFLKSGALMLWGALSAKG